MSTSRDAVKNILSAQVISGATEHRLKLPTEAAVQLAKELQPNESRDPEKLAVAIKSFEELAAMKEPATVDGKIAFYKQHEKVANDFWDSFEGQTVEGVEIFRRR